MPNLMISRKDNKAVNFEGDGTYFFVTTLGMYIKVKCMAVFNLEVKNKRPLIYLDVTNVKTFDFC